MKYFQIVSRDDEDSKKIAKLYQDKLRQNGFYENEQPEVVIAIGGDGTMLDAFKMYQRFHPAFIGLHTGTLGFLNDWQKSEQYDLLQHLIYSTPRISELSILQFTVFYQDHSTRTFFALNDLVVKGFLSTFQCDISINGMLFEHFQGDGVVISSAPGMTAYGLSAGGAVGFPKLECIQLKGLSPLNNAKHRSLERPLIFSKDQIVKLVPKKGQGYLLGYDRTSLDSTHVEQIEAKVADEKVRFVRYRPFPFWSRVKEKFLDD